MSFTELEPFMHRVRFILPLGVLAVAAPATAQVALDPASTIPTGSQPSGVAIGDFTNDGIADLAVVVEGPDRIEIHAGDGLGGFSLAGSAILPSSSSPGVLAAGDLDGDGDLDLMVALKDFLTVQVVTNQAGTLVAGAQFGTGDETKSIDLGDIDGDGDLDAITVNRRDDSATLLVNTGGGAFTGTQFATGADPRGATFGDFDGDGDLDIAMSAHDDRLIDILRNTNGSFSPWTSLSTGAQLRPEGVTATDLDGDGDDDLAAAVNGAIGDFAAVWLSGGGGFGAMNTTASGGTNASEIATADLDCNGLPDLVVLNIDSPNLGVLQNLGGTFGAATTVAVGTDPEYIAIGDADGDGDLDIAATSRFANTVTLTGGTCGTGGGDPVCGNGVCEPGETTDCVDCQGGGGPVCGDGICDPTEGPDCVDCQNNQPGDFTFATAAAALGTRPMGMAMLDADGDGDLDLATTVEGPDRVQFVLNTGGAFTAGGFVATGASSSPQELVAGDFDGDGDDDLLVVIRDLMVVRTLRNDGGVFTNAGDAAIGERGRGLSIGDLDGDGDLDAAIANRLSDTATILVNAGDGTFTGTTIPAAGEPRGTAIGDFDGDGQVEIAVSAHDVSAIRIHGPAAGGHAVESTLSTGVVRPEGLATGDFNGDGLTDLAAAVNGDAFEGVRTWSAGKMGLVPAATAASGVVNTSVIAVGDLDCDGDLDIAAVGTDSNSIGILAGDGTGGFAPGLAIATGIAPKQIALGDLDGDGDLDVATSNRDSNNATIASNDSCPDTGIVGDLNGDGAVNGADAGLLLAAWGTADAAADLDGSGLVDGADIGIMLANWNG